MQSAIERQVMAAVGVIYVARLLVSRTAVELYVLAASSVAIWQLTWVHKVFENFFTALRGGLPDVSTYLLVAVTHAHLAVQLTLVVAAVAGITFILDMARALSPAHSVIA
jgi:hypothetical protein